jgi:hypothetical protein
MLSFRRTSSSLLFLRGAVSTRVTTPQRITHPSSMRFISTSSIIASSPSLSKGATSFRRKLRRTPEYGEAILSSPAIHNYGRRKRGDGEDLLKVFKREHGGHSHAAALAQSGDEAQTKSEFWVTWLGLARYV